MRTIWCRHDNCGKPYDSVAGYRPAICPACQHPEAWSTEPYADTDIPTVGFTDTDELLLQAIARGAKHKPDA